MQVTAEKFKNWCGIWCCLFFLISESRPANLVTRSRRTGDPDLDDSICDTRTRPGECGSTLPGTRAANGRFRGPPSLGGLPPDPHQPMDVYRNWAVPQRTPPRIGQVLSVIMTTRVKHPAPVDDACCDFIRPLTGPRRMVAAGLRSANFCWMDIFLCPCVMYLLWACQEVPL
jgi:hypothetical protein